MRGWSARWRWLTVGAVALLLAGLYLTPQSGVQQRVGVAMEEAADYLAGEPNGSVGARLEMYRGALLLIPQLSMAIKTDPPAVNKIECARQSLVIRETEEVERMS